MEACRIKKYLAKIVGFAFAFAFLLNVVPVMQVEAAEIDYTIRFQLDEKKSIIYEKGQGQVGDTITVRDTYYDKQEKKDYDLVGQDSQILKSGKKEYIFQYESYKAPSIEGSVTLATTEGKILKTTALTIGAESSVTYDVPETFLENNVKTYERKEGEPKQITLKYNDQEVDCLVLYKEVTNFEPYTVKVNYVDDNNGILQSKSFKVTGSTYIYYAPLTLKLTKGDTVTYYNVESNASSVITHDPSSTTREYNIKYNAFDGKSTYNWYIYKYDGYSNSRLGKVEVKEVAVGQSITYTPKKSITSGGTTYKLDPGMAKTYTHQYGDSDRVLYVYYNPEGYVPEGSYNINVQYRNIADNSIIYSTSVTAEPGDNTYITCPAEYNSGSINYVRLDGQKDTVTHSYYSPKREYNIYYRDINDTQYENTVITREETITTVETVYDTVTITGATTTTGGTTAGGTAGDEPTDEPAAGTGDDSPATGGATDGTTDVRAEDPTTGETEVQATETPSGDQVIVEDEDVPLGDLTDQQDAEKSFLAQNGKYVLSAILALLILAGSITVAMKKKR